MPSRRMSKAMNIAGLRLLRRARRRARRARCMRPCSRWNPAGRPRSSSATISPSRMTGPFSFRAAASSAFTIAGNCAVFSLPLRDQIRAVAPFAPGDDLDERPDAVVLRLVDEPLLLRAAPRPASPASGADPSGDSSSRLDRSDARFGRIARQRAPTADRIAPIAASEAALRARPRPLDPRPRLRYPPLDALPSEAVRPGLPSSARSSCACSTPLWRRGGEVAVRDLQPEFPGAGLHHADDDDGPAAPEGRAGAAEGRPRVRVPGGELARRSSSPGS